MIMFFCTKFLKFDRMRYLYNEYLIYVKKNFQRFEVSDSDLTSFRMNY